jgi:hypothetical protein
LKKKSESEKGLMDRFNQCRQLRENVGGLVELYIKVSMLSTVKVVVEIGLTISTLPGKKTMHLFAGYFVPSN